MPRWRYVFSCGCSELSVWSREEEIRKAFLELIPPLTRFVEVHESALRGEALREEDLFFGRVSLVMLVAMSGRSSHRLLLDVRSPIEGLIRDFNLNIPEGTPLADPDVARMMQMQSLADLVTSLMDILDEIDRFGPQGLPLQELKGPKGLQIRGKVDAALRLVRQVEHRFLKAKIYGKVATLPPCREVGDLTTV